MSDKPRMLYEVSSPTLGTIHFEEESEAQSCLIDECKLHQEKATYAVFVDHHSYKALQDANRELLEALREIDSIPGINHSAENHRIKFVAAKAIARYNEKFPEGK